MRQDQRIFILKAFNVIQELKQDTTRVMSGFMEFEKYQKRLDVGLDMLKSLIDTWEATHK